MRNKFWTKPFENRVEWFMDKVVESVDSSGRVKWLSFVIEGGKKVCGTCFRKLYRIDKNFYYKYLKKAQQGKQSASVRYTRSYSESRNLADTWLDCYAFYHADRMPDTGVLMLPYRTRKIDIYNLYKNEMTDQFKYPVSKSLFYNIWNRKKNLKIKQTNSFSKCNTCVHLERELEKTRDPESRTKLKSMVAVHNERQMNERRYYYEKKDKAKDYPRRFLSLIVDGMDQSKTNLPHFTGRLLKGVDPNSFLKTHVQGILNHGCSTFKCYVDINEYSHDSNLVMNTLLRAIHDSQSKLGTLPEVLFLQADNCGRENKNKYVMSFCELLVRLHVFSEIHLSFLPVGHTHEDIDAKFSYLADLLRRNDTETLPALLHVLPNTIQTRGLFDIKQWLEPCINKVTNHSKPLHFKFCKMADSKVSFQFKSSSPKDWTLSEITLLDDIPNGTPDILIPPHFGKIITHSLTDNILKHKYNMEDRQFWWWQRFIAEIEKISTNDTKLQEYAAHEAVWLLPYLNTVAEGSPAKEIKLKPHLTEMLDKELEDHQVFVKAKKVKQKQK
ncbi:uncharacterized protein LOC123534087 [Mercenaria mercenaria]|uniref:uncharacterized protein LOC123534087 n=1 Tax=Mercenaria mercenaria TaxID=6596 RepID=UPI00234EEE23|nr:uncharacterized protein LOC123534087 [Mercenaria mercenaria]XP_053403790.1 uncharacterized protein LOC123534087 [Mercenaria mercenaria]